MIDGKRVKELRNAKGYTREEFAELIGISPMQAYKYESGKSDATGEVIARMSNLFDVSTDYLLGVSDNPHKAQRNFTEEEIIIINSILNNQLRDVAQAILDLHAD